MGEMRRKYARTLFESHEIPTPQHDRIVRWLDQCFNEYIAEHEEDPVPNDFDRNVGRLKASVLNKTVTCRGTVEHAARRERVEGNIAIAEYLDSLLETYPSPRACLELPPHECDWRITWEKPVVSSDGFVVGFLDMWVECDKASKLKAVTYQFPKCTGLEFQMIEADYTPMGQGYEIKPRIDSVGAVIRQIRFYETYLKAHKYHVVAPEGDYREDLAYQGIGFIAIPPEVLRG